MKKKKKKKMMMMNLAELADGSTIYVR